MNWHEMIKFNEEHLKEFVDNKDFWKRFNELEVLFEVLDDDLRGYERIKYITLNEFMLKSVLNEVREVLGNYRHYSTPDEIQNRLNEDLVDKAYIIVNKALEGGSNG